MGGSALECARDEKFSKDESKMNKLSICNVFPRDHIWYYGERNKAGQKRRLITTAIHTIKYRNPSDLRSQASDGSVSTVVGDHTGILGAVVLFNF